MIIMQLHNIVGRKAAGINSIPVISYDIERISGDQLSLHGLLDDADFSVGQAVDLVDELVDLIVGRVDLALDE